MMMIGGGAECDRTDHGIGVTVAKEASFADKGRSEYDFDDSVWSGGRTSAYYIVH